MYCKRRTGGMLRILNCALLTGSSPCTMPKQNIHCSAHRLSYEELLNISVFEPAAFEI